MNRAVVTGIGAVTPLGTTFQKTWAGALSGISGIALTSRIDAAHLPWKMAGEVKAFDGTAEFGVRKSRRLDLFVQYALAASLEALRDSGISSRSYLESGGVVIGSSRGGISALELAIAGRNYKKARTRISPFLMPSTTVGMAAAAVARETGATGYTLGISNACASGANALGEALRMVRGGCPGPLFAGGADAPLTTICFEGYGASGLLSKRMDPSASRPFAADRDGFVLSEGAAVMVIENEETARKRGARIYGEIAGYSAMSDGSHETRPDIKGQVRTMEAAVRDAGLSPEEIDYVNAHATATVVGDRTEAAAILQRFGHARVSAPKSITGHMLGASGTLEAAFTLMTMKEGIIPPTLNLADEDPICGLDIVRKKTEAHLRCALSNSFGFGGLNAVLVLKPARE